MENTRFFEFKKPYLILPFVEHDVAMRRSVSFFRNWLRRE